MRSPHFPKEYAQRMVKAGALNKETGFYGVFFPLAMSKQSMKKFDSPVDHSFGYTPDTAYFTLDGMFRQGLKKEATELTLNHLANYNSSTRNEYPSCARSLQERSPPLWGPVLQLQCRNPALFGGSRRTQILTAQ